MAKELIKIEDIKNGDVIEVTRRGENEVLVSGEVTSVWIRNRRLEINGKRYTLSGKMLENTYDTYKIPQSELIKMGISGYTKFRDTL